MFIGWSLALIGCGAAVTRAWLSPSAARGGCVRWCSRGPLSVAGPGRGEAAGSAGVRDAEGTGPGDACVCSLRGALPPYRGTALLCVAESSAVGEGAQPPVLPAVLDLQASRTACHDPGCLVRPGSLGGINERFGVEPLNICVSFRKVKHPDLVYVK